MSLKYLYGAPASISLDRRPDQPVSVVSLRGEVDLRVHAELRELLWREVDAGRHLVVDLTNVDFLDSTGLGLLVGVLKRVRERGERLGQPPTQLILVVGGEVERTLEITGLDRVFTRVFRAEDAEALI
jgi:anti-sigma B factor antagonist